ncbi:MAG: AraC family transcriptional regulator [Kiritimatiellae bacterium]|nr:AraC family transcriptional regulator [Kiritimatiellia bacterium]
MLWAYHGPVRSQFSRTLFGTAGITAWRLNCGEVKLEFAGGSETFGRGQWIFPKAQEAMQTFSSDTHLLSIRFEAEWSDATPLFERLQTVTVPAGEAGPLNRIGEQLADRLTYTPTGTDPLEHTPHTLDGFFESQQLFYGWMSSYVCLMMKLGFEPRRLQPLDERVWIAITRMDARPMSRPLREEEVGAMAGLSVAQLNRLFVEGLGKTIAEYWEDRRRKAALSALLESSRSIKSIAYDLGFSSLPHFSAWVKKRLGHSPRTLRKLHNIS